MNLSGNESTINSTNNDSQTNIGRILDNRYKIIRVIGEGGFGITYEAVNLHNDQRTAIKEHKEEGKNEINLKEARVLRDFADDPAIVTVLDSFIENNKAYMVMEYLDGYPLTEEIKKNGKWSTEKTVHTFIPIMNALSRMHKAGVIHRDISPDNLMYMSDGSLILMDFGAAKEIHKNNFTRTSIYKSVYSPPEQREPGEPLGSYSDIYALCSTIYYCLTGCEPEDSLLRLLYDELKNPSEIGSDILPRAEKILMKGLELRSENRLQNIDDLKLELETVYPDLSEEEKIREIQQKKRRKRIWLSAIFSLILLLFGFVYHYRIQIRFLSIETQNIMLDGTILSNEDFRTQADGVKERVQAFAGKDNYLWEEDQQKIKLIIPSNLFYPVDPFDFVRTNLTRQNVLSIEIPEEKKDLGIFSQNTDLTCSLNTDNNYLITFSDEAITRLGNILNEKDNKLRFYLNKAGGYRDYCFFDGYSDGSGKGVIIDQNEIRPVTDQLAMLHFNKEPLNNNFPVQTEWKIRWETRQNAMFPGKNQLNPEEIPSQTITIKYSPARTPENIEGYDYLELFAIFKNRMDSLNIPYAIGVDSYNDKTIVIKVPLDSIWGEELFSIGLYFNINMGIGSKFALADSISMDTLELEHNDDGTFAIVLKVKEKEKYLEILNTIKEQGENELYLYFWKEKAAISPLESAFKTLDENDNISFSKWNSNELQMDESTLHFANFLVVGKEQNADLRYNMQKSPVEIRNENGEIIYFDYASMIPEYRFDKQQTLEMVEQWNKEYNYKNFISYNNDLEDKALAVRFYNVDLSRPESALSGFENFFQKYSNELSSGDFKAINLYLFSGENSSDPLITSTLNMNFETGFFQIFDFFDYWFFAYNFQSSFHNDVDEELLLKEYKAYLQESSFWQPFLP